MLRRQKKIRRRLAQPFGHDHGTLENGVEKIAIYGAGLMYTHAARQLPDGSWSSKLGQLEDIVHSTVEALVGSDYGEVVQFMKRQIRD